MSDGSYRDVTEAEFRNTFQRQGLNLGVLPQLDPAKVPGVPGVPGAIGPAGTLDPSPKGFAANFEQNLKDTQANNWKNEFTKRSFTRKSIYFFQRL